MADQKRYRVGAILLLENGVIVRVVGYFCRNGFHKKEPVYIVKNPQKHQFIISELDGVKIDDPRFRDWKIKGEVSK